MQRELQLENVVVAIRSMKKEMWPLHNAKNLPTFAKGLISLSLLIRTHLKKLDNIFKDAVCKVNWVRSQKLLIDRFGVVHDQA